MYASSGEEGIDRCEGHGGRGQRERLKVSKKEAVGKEEGCGTARRQRTEKQREAERQM